MIPPRNLVPGQYQIGNLIFGRGTTVPVETFDIKPYDVNPQDHQVTMSDEIRFGIDSFKPTTIEVTFHVLYNRLLHPYESLIPNFWADMPKAADFQREWRFDEGRKMWGSIKPIYCCGKDNVTRMVFGRPRHFTYAKDSNYSESVQCLGEFQRSDTLSYSSDESYLEMAGGSNPWELTRTGGDSDTWFRVLAYGPMTNPKFTVGPHNIDLDIDILEGEALEVSSYPWMRRAINSNRVNLATNMIGQSQYLDRMTLPLGSPVQVRWTSDQLNTWVPDLGNQTWEQDIDTLKMAELPATFTTLGGRVAVRFDLFNKQPSKFIGAALFANTAAIIYSHKQYNTAYQYAEAQITEPWYGRSGIVIMSNPAMTNYAVLEVVSGIGGSGNYLRIRTGTAYNAYSSVRAEWHNTASSGWLETDKVGIGYDPPTKTFSAYFNGTSMATWPDSGDVVNSANRNQGFIFDMDGNLLTAGTGFRNIVAYDRSGSFIAPITPGQYPPGPPPTGSLVGRAFLFWHDAWSTIV